MILKLDAAILDPYYIPTDSDGLKRNACSANPNSGTTLYWTLSYTINGVTTIEYNNEPIVTPQDITLLIPVNGYADVNITIRATNYNTYNSVWRLFNYDIGKFDTDTFNTTNPIQIILIPEDSRTSAQILTNNPSYKLPVAYSSFLAVREPLSNALYLYKTNSSLGTTTYYDSNANVLGVGDNIITCCPNNVTISQLTQTYVTEVGECCGSTTSLFSTCLSDEFPITQINLIPTITTQVKSDCECDTTCVSSFSNPSVINTLDLSSVDCLFINGVTNTFIQDLDNLNLITKVYGIGSVINGSTVQGYEIKTNTVDVLPLLDTSPKCPLVIDSTRSSIYQNTVTFDVPLEGDYIVKVELDGVITGEKNLFTCVKTDTFYGCQWFSISRVECNKIRLINKSLTDATGLIYKVINGEFSLFSTIVIPACSYNDQTLLDGVYKFVGTNSNNQTNIVAYPEVITCQVQTCWFDKNKALLCCSSDTTCNEKDVYIYNTMSAQMSYLYTLLNDVYNFGSIGVELNVDELNTLYTVDSIITRILTYYCDNCTTSTCNSSINAATSCTSCN